MASEVIASPRRIIRPSSGLRGRVFSSGRLGRMAGIAPFQVRFTYSILSTFLGGFAAMRYLIGALLVLFLAAIAVFALQNINTVIVTFLNWKIEAPFAIVAVVIYLLGMVSGWSVVSFIRRSIRRVSAD
jgi:putative membrane protein